MKDDCIFCKLANGVFDTHTLYEDEKFRVIFDINPATRGHALVIPKKHFDNIFEIDDNTLSRAIVITKKVAFAMKKAFNLEGINILQNNGEIAGQTVFHFHIHLIPRYAGDHAIKQWETLKVTDEELNKLEKVIKDNL